MFSKFANKAFKGNFRTKGSYQGKTVGTIPNFHWKENQGKEENVFNSRKTEYFKFSAYITTISLATLLGISFIDAEERKKSSEGTSHDPRPEVIDSIIFQQGKLVKIHSVNLDTKIYTFQVPQKDIEIPVASTYAISAIIDHEVVTRYYSPISDINNNGEIQFIIKTIPTGKLSHHLSHMKEGDLLQISRFPIKEIAYKPNMIKKIVFLAGGADGIGPAVQLLRKIVNNPKDETEVHLVFANKSEKDILLKNELDELAQKDPAHFRVSYVLEKPPAHWDFNTEYIAEETIKRYIDLDPKKDSDYLIMVSGPSNMMKQICGEARDNGQQGPLEGLLKKMGFEAKSVYKF